MRLRRQALPIQQFGDASAHKVRQRPDAQIARAFVKTLRPVVEIGRQQKQVAVGRAHRFLDGRKQAASDAATFVTGPQRDQPQITAAAKVSTGRTA